SSARCTARTRLRAPIAMSCALANARSCRAQVQKMNLLSGAPGSTSHRMSTYGQFCPVALGAEIFAERWTPLIVRELLAGGRRFSDIHRVVPNISRNLLVQRLESLQRSGIIDRRKARNGRGHEYRLTDAGRELGTVIDALGTWGYKWASKDLTDEHLDPDFLMWALRRMAR